MNQKRKIQLNNFYEVDQRNDHRRRSNMTRVKEYTEQKKSTDQAPLTDAQQLTPTNYGKTSPIRRSPSFRLKQYQYSKEIGPLNMDNIHRKNRISALGNFMQQLDLEDKKKPVQDKSSDMATVSKQAPPSDTTLEEVHFYLVQQMQRTKRISMTMETKNMGL